MTNEWPSDIYVLIPSYKSIRQLKGFVDELTTIVPKQYICVVDDASGDGTYEYCVDNGIVCLRHHKNRGKGAALRTGFSHLSTDKSVKWIITMDADGQHSPTDLHRFIKESRARPGMGLCIGARDMRLGVMPIARILSNRVTSLILTIMTGRLIKDSQCGFRMYSREFVTSIKIKYDRFEMESEVILKAAAKKNNIRFVPVRTLYLRDGASHISHLTDTLRWIAAVIAVYISRFWG